MKIKTVEQDQVGPVIARYAFRMIKRTDRMTAFHVDLAINMAASHGVHAGARALFESGLSLELARRVLLRPTMRRLPGRPTPAPTQLHPPRAPGL